MIPPTATEGQAPPAQEAEVITDETITDEITTEETPGDATDTAADSSVEEDDSKE